MKALDELVNLLARLPGIGKKSAARMAFFLLKGDGQYASLLGSRIAGIRDAVRFCTQCGSYTDRDICDVCSSPARDRQQLCVVEQPHDVLTIEASREYHGLYHVLGGLISPLEGVGPETLHLDRLHDRVRTLGIREVVLATNPTVEGDTTALYVKKILEDTGVGLSRLATGIPVGGDLEYADRLTLARSFRGRIPL
ncbi:MAG: recombination mediator RecR [Spirochaetes bacterium]|nr:recombination mediator RecR [Spirochaetota bacterium]MBU0955372.1 recombination mediator RecR [Spirochaetota bacterium]